MTVVSFNGGEWTAEQVHRETGQITSVKDVLDSVPSDGLEEVLIVGRLHDGTLYLAGSHNQAYSALLAAQAHHIVIRAVELCE